MINLDVRFLPYSEIVDIAEDFLRENNIDTIPVPIEDIIDIDYGIDIIPTPGLLSVLETDGFITPDFRVSTLTSLFTSRDIFVTDLPLPTKLAI